MLDIEVYREPSNADLASRALAEGLGFGRVFADRMFHMAYAEGRGWYDPQIVPYGKLTLDPAAMVFHYGQELFEGHKAYRWTGGKIGLFRPQANHRRLNRTAQRMRMPTIPEEQQMEATLELVRQLRDWVPDDPGASLYLRPTMIASEAGLGVRPATEYLYFIIASPVGPYFPSGFNPVKVRAESEFIRAAVGGTGGAKTGGNYAGALFAQAEAKKDGYVAVLWLDAKERKYVEEIGAMNVMFVLDGRIVTSPLSGSILPGITRDSILRMAPDLGFEVEERQLAITELIAWIRQGRVTEAFGAGTAAVITPIGAIGWQGQDHQVADGGVGPTARRLYQAITDIQYGRSPDPYGWMTVID